MDKKIKLFVGTPMHGGVCYGEFTNSCINLVNTTLNTGIECFFYHIYNDALVSRARNNIVDVFLQTDCTHLLFIDADICFDPRDVLSMLKADRDIIGAPYAKKAINWAKVVNAVKNIPDINPKDIEKFVGDIVFNTKSPITNLNEPQEVEEIGAGFMLMKRNVFEKIFKAYPQLQYINDEGKEIFNYFPTFIDNKGSVTDGGSNRYLSEDYSFCKMWSKIGGKIWIAPWIVLKHIGTFSYTCDLPFICQSFNQKQN